MKYEIIQPCDQLKDLISHFWIGTWENSQKANSIHYIIASSLTEITFAFKDDKKNSELLFTSIQGQTDQPNQHAVENYNHLVGVAFYSHAFPYMFNIPASELNNEYLSLDTFLGYNGRILEEKIVSAVSTEQRIRILSEFFISLLQKQKFEDELVMNVIGSLKKSNGDVKMIDIASEFKISQKQLTRRFKTFTGFNPKVYSRIIRFESVVKNYPRVQNFTELSYLNNYYDQAHFIHEFKTLSGFTPKDFWKLSEE
ncbi:AraC family transcriptional regulator [Paracrocinitomix mangrovi]|uniref:helix-turn-helix domain-containing protein n=1 Tax=Paracrocinitomix mangrovi TaxID=2862509 RepID=UPI001C8DDF64|nr:AraC family transcriptional regulator [Paracrocinitomix mangrovi]UKN02272.1 AraC family transcriptional regulator [Paracrocinitomix mangrovi]